MSLYRAVVSTLYNGLKVSSRSVLAPISSLQKNFSTLGQARASSLDNEYMTRPSLLAPSHEVLLQSNRTYKMKSALKLRCSGCYYERRFGRLFVECTLKPRHKQMQLQKGTRLYKDDYSTGKWKKSIHWLWKERQGFYNKGNNEYARMNWLEGKIGTEV